MLRLHREWTVPLAALVASRLCSAEAGDDNAGGSGGGSGGDGATDDNAGGGGLMDLAKSGGTSGTDGDAAAKAASEAAAKSLAEAEKAGRVIVSKGSDGKEIKLAVPEKFWDAKGKAVNAAAVVKAYGDLERDHSKLVADGKAKAAADVPAEAKDYLDASLIKDGVMQRPEGVTKLADLKADDPGLTAFAGIAKKHGLSREQFRGIIADTMLFADTVVPAPFDAAAEVKALGDNGQAKVLTAVSYVDSLLAAKKITAAQHKALFHVGKTAAGVGAILALRAEAGMTDIPLNTDTADGGASEWKTQAEWYQKMPKPSDEAQYAKWQARGKELFGEGQSGTSPSGLGVGGDNNASQLALREREEQRGGTNQRRRRGEKRA